MKKYQEEFIEFILEVKALKFGTFTLKSGRVSPFFFNAGSFYKGEYLSKLGYFYAQLIEDKFKEDFDVLFGPSYKGIPLSVITTLKLYELFKRDISYSTNRKEIKDHGEQGVFLGSSLTSSSKIVLIDDVITSGKSVEETFKLFNDFKVNPIVLGLVVSIDREEKASEDLSALESVSKRHNIKTYSIIKMSEAITYIRKKHPDIIDDELHLRILEYYKQYGANK